MSEFDEHNDCDLDEGIFDNPDAIMEEIKTRAQKLKEREENGDYCKGCRMNLSALLSEINHPQNNKFANLTHIWLFNNLSSKEDKWYNDMIIALSNDPMTVIEYPVPEDE